MIHGSPWRPITHQGASICKLRDVCDGGESVLECQRGNGLTQVIEGGVGHDDHGLGRLARKSRKGGTEFTAVVNSINRTVTPIEPACAAVAFDNSHFAGVAGIVLIAIDLWTRRVALGFMIRWR